MNEIKPKTKPAAPDEHHGKAKPAAPDEHHGKGGHYEIRNGQRVLVQRTKPKE